MKTIREEQLETITGGNYGDNLLEKDNKKALYSVGQRVEVYGKSESRYTRPAKILEVRYNANLGYEYVVEYENAHRKSYYSKEILSATKDVVTADRIQKL